METVKTNDDGVASPPVRTFINHLPDWSMLLATITTVFLAAEKQWMMLDWKPRRTDMLIDPFGFGRIVQDGLVFRQNFSIRLYEIGADRTASIEMLMNHLQETALNHVKTAGLLGDGFGSTPEISKRNLIWVVTKIQVKVDRYPTCVWVMMNKLTRRLSKMPEEVQQEIVPYFVNSDPVVEEDGTKLEKLDDNAADFIRKGLTPRWNDLDVNHHVNNVKYLGWILESASQPILESRELSGLTLEYRRECGGDNVLQSMTVVSSGGVGDLGHYSNFDCQHLLRLQDGAEVIRGRPEWRPKYSNIFDIMGQILEDTA